MGRVWTTLLLSLTCVFLLSSCTPKQAESAPYDPALVQELVQADAFSEELESVDADTAFALYRLADYAIAREDMLSCTVLRSTGATCEEVAVVLLRQDETILAQGEQALLDYVQWQIESNEDYRPAEISKLEQALVSRQGASLLLVVAADFDAAKGVLDK